MSDFYAKLRSDVEAQMEELQPAIREYERLSKILQAIDSEGQSPAAAGPPQSRPSRRRSEPRSAGHTRPKGVERRPSEPRGRRAREVMEIIRSEPGLPIPEIAHRLKIRPGYLYQLLPRLVEQGIVLERDKGWHPVSAEATGAASPHAGTEAATS